MLPSSFLGVRGLLAPWTQRSEAPEHIRLALTDENRVGVSNSTVQNNHNTLRVVHLMARAVVSAGAFDFSVRKQEAEERRLPVSSKLDSPTKLYLPSES